MKYKSYKKVGIKLVILASFRQPVKVGFPDWSYVIVVAPRTTYWMVSGLLYPQEEQ